MSSSPARVRIVVSIEQATNDKVEKRLTLAFVLTVGAFFRTAGLAFATVVREEEEEAEAEEEVAEEEATI